MDRETIEKNDYNLNISLYAHALDAMSDDNCSLEQSMSGWEKQHAETIDNINQLTNLL